MSTAPMMSVYALLDSRSGNAHYVGVTRQPLHLRLIAHRQEAKRRPGSGKALWLTDVADAGAVIVPITLERVAEADAADAERKWQARLEGANEPLTNARRAGTGTRHSHNSRWTPEVDALLGVLPDEQVAQMVGVTRKAASYRRRVLGVAPLPGPLNPSPPPWKGGWNKVELPIEAIALLGTMSDDALGERFGVSKKRIMAERHARSVPSFASSSGQDGRYGSGRPALGRPRATGAKAKR